MFRKKETIIGLYIRKVNEKDCLPHRNFCAINEAAPDYPEQLHLFRGWLWLFLNKLLVWW
jgi:hypothetical protein